MDDRAKEIIGEGGRLFADRAPLLSTWQDIAENFYPERADFTTTRSVGDEFADHLMTGYPLLVRQELANAIAGMLRPPGQAWFNIKLEDVEDENEPQALRQWLDRLAAAMRKAMYDPAAMLSRATKQADNDYVAFGNSAISVEPDWRETRLLYRPWHLRDVAWRSDYAGKINEVHRRWKCSAYDIMAQFPKTFAPELAQIQDKEKRTREFECRHIVMPRERYSGPVVSKDATNGRDVPRDAKYVGLFVDVENEHIMEAMPRETLGYVIPRWQVGSSSAYGWSPTTVASLSDARMLQDMTRTILEAGEKAVDPPMVATQEVVRSNIAFEAGGITWVDAQYDEKTGAAIRPLNQDSRGIPLGLDMQQDLREQIATAWMLNKLNLPAAGDGDMTAYEVGQRVQEYIRQAIPLFEPMEAEYNGALCDETFAALLSVGAFGRPDQWPEEVRGRSIKFTFENPFTAAREQEALAQYQATTGVLATQLEIDPNAAANLDLDKMHRDATKGAGGPASWLRDERDAAEVRSAMEERQQMLQAMQQAAMGGEAAEAVGKGVQALGGQAA